MSIKKTKKAFTLVELLVVIAILAILATASVIGYNSFINKANKSVDEQLVAQLNVIVTADSVLDSDYSVEDAYESVKENGLAISTSWLRIKTHTICYNTFTNKFFISSNDGDVYGMRNTDNSKNYCCISTVDDYIEGFNVYLNDDFDYRNIEFTDKTIDTHTVKYLDKFSVTLEHDYNDLDKCIKCGYEKPNGNILYNDHYYDSISAITSFADNSTITVLKDYTENSTIQIGAYKDLVIDLGGNTIAFNPSGDSNLINIVCESGETCNVTIKNGTLNHGSYVGICLDNSGSLTLNYNSLNFVGSGTQIWNIGNTSTINN